MTRESESLPVDFPLEEYLIDSVLGVGGFGITYKARDTFLDKWVVIKEFFPTDCAFRSDDGFNIRADAEHLFDKGDKQVSYFEWGLDRFLHEARALARIEHPNVVQLKRYFRANNTAYIVMDYEDGKTLQTILSKQGTLSEEEVVGLLNDVLPALQLVHDQGYLHRDIKPDNLFIRARDGVAMLIDFGAARMALSQASSTVTGLVSKGYSPPEQYSSDSELYGCGSDIYALGAVLYRCITGQAPAPAPERQLRDMLVPAVVAGDGRYHPGLLKIVDRALVLRREDRYQNVAEMQNAVASIQHGGDDQLHDVAVGGVVEGIRIAARRQQSTGAVVASMFRRLSRFSVVGVGFVALTGLAIVAYLWLFPGESRRTEGIPRYLIVDGKAILNPELESTGANNVDQPSASRTYTDPVVSAPVPGTSDLEQPIPLEPPAIEFIAESTGEEPLEDTGLAEAPPPSLPEKAAQQPGSDPQAGREVERLLRLAEQSLREKRLTTPQNNNAHSYYSRVLRLQPDNQAAQRGVAKIADTYAQFADMQARQASYRKAKRYVDLGLAVAPQHPQLLAIEQEVDRLIQGEPESHSKVTEVGQGFNRK